MLGKFAHDLSTSLGGKPLTTQQEALEAQKQGGKLWDVMVEMTQPGSRVTPRAGDEGKREKKLLDVKYKIFREAVEVQRRWRGMIAEVEA